MKEVIDLWLEVAFILAAALFIAFVFGVLMSLCFDTRTRRKLSGFWGRL